MDHLWFPGTSQVPPYRIPYIALPRHLRKSQGGFKSLLMMTPTERDNHAARLEEFRKTSKSRFVLGDLIFAVQIQETVFFPAVEGFLKAFGVPYERNDFLKRDSDGQYLSTEKLPSVAETIALNYFRLYKNKHPDKDISNRINILSNSSDPLNIKDVKHCRPQKLDETSMEPIKRGFNALMHPCVSLQKIYTLLMRQFNGRIQNWDWGIIDAWIAASVLIETLLQLAAVISGEDCRPRTFLFTPDLAAVFSAKFAVVRRCAYQSRMLLRGRTAEAVFAASLPGMASFSHIGCCGDSGCMARPMFSEITMPLHRPGCNSCKELKLGLEDANYVKSILESQSFPVLSTEIRDEKLIVLDVKSSNGYIALSHVWAHGLGNPLDNSLPECQIKFITSKLRETDVRHSAFWIDTICVPRNSRHRRLAIRQMRETFEKADAVVVFDRELLSTGHNIHERQCRLLLSDWMTRLWTLQEALLAQQLHIAFRDNVVPLSQVLFSEHTVPNYTLQEALLDTQHGARLALNVKPEKNSLLEIASSLHGRTTTNSEDEAICLCTLLGIGLEHLPQHAEIEHVFAFLREFPQDILFCYGPRNSKLGFKWAPKSLLHKRGLPKTYRAGEGQPNASLTTEGLRVSKAAIQIFDPLQYTPRCKSDVDNESWNRYVISDGVSKFRYIYDWDATSKRVNSQDRLPQKFAGAYLLCESVDKIGKTYCDAVLVCDVVERAGVMHCHFVEIFMTIDYDDCVRTDQDLSQVEVVQGKWIDERLWCID